MPWFAFAMGHLGGFFVGLGMGRKWPGLFTWRQAKKSPVNNRAFFGFWTSPANHGF